MCEMTDKKTQKNTKKFCCENCDFYSNNKTLWIRHLQTKKHNTYTYLQNTYTKGTKTDFVCECGKIYKHRQSLHNHKKKCNYLTNETTDITTINIDDIKDNDPNLKQMFMTLMEQNQKLMELTVNVAAQPKTINNQFNIMNYLNTECKDALNLTDFIEQLKYTFNDLIKITEEGWVNNVENTFIKELKNMEETKRPIHCSDKKRKKFYIKDFDVWEKDDKQDKIKSAINKFHKKQSQTYIKWKQMNKKEVDRDDKLQDKSMYMNIELCKVSCENGEKLQTKLLNSLCDLSIMKDKQ